MLSSDYEKIISLGGFDVTDDEHHMKPFCKNYGLKNLIRQPTCYKNPSNPVCIDLILTNVPRSFQSTCEVETGLSDFLLITLTVMRKSFKKYQPKTINDKYRKTSINRETLINSFFKENFINNDDGFQRFCHLSLDALNKHAPCKKKKKKKKKHALGNQMLFLNKGLSKAIVTTN